jgi:molecular chaperone DnaK (HSP70)
MGSRVIGIDLGTSNSCVATVHDGRAVVLSDDQRTTIPSCVAFHRDRELVGTAAKRHAVTSPHSTVLAVKRLIGHAFDSPEVQTARERLPYPIQRSPLGSVSIEVAGQNLTPVDIASRILRRIREIAENAIGEPVRRAVISVPAHFNDVQRKATKLAAEHAGLEVLRLVNEPTAAAFAYGYKKGRNFTLAVYDLGGGTFDVTLMRAVGDTFEVIATDGDPFLGGEDLDQAIVEWLASELEHQHGITLGRDHAAWPRLKEAAEKAKIELTDVPSTRIELPFLAQHADGRHIDFEVALPRERLDDLVRPLLERTLSLCRRCLDHAGVRTEGIDDVLLVGGQSRMPSVRRAVAGFFGREPRRDINPDEVVAMGAALFGYSLASDTLRREAEDAAGEAFALAWKHTAVARRMVDEVDRLCHSSEASDALASRLEELLKATGEDEDLPGPGGRADRDLPQGVDGLREELLELDYKAAELIEKLAREIEAGGDDTPIPLAAARERLGSHIEEAREAECRAQTHLQEAEQHALARKVKLQDVTSLPLGIAAAADVFTLLIDQNTKVPAEHRRVFTTSQDGQAEVEIRVHQGRATHASENQRLGSFVLEGIVPAPRMQPRIEVEFRIDEDGILSVRARDVGSGQAQAMRIEDPLGLQQAAPLADDAGISDDVIAAAVEDSTGFDDSTGAREIELPS